MQKIVIIALLAAVVAPISAAQMRGRGGAAIGGARFGHFRGGGFGYPLFYSDYFPESEVAPAAAPVVVEKKVVQPERLAEPLLIEWSGDRFVRYGGTQPAAQSPDYAETASATKGMSSDVVHEPPPAVLVYRDGHREEVSDYVITGGVIYARGDGYSQPSRNIQLSALDLRTTFRANQDNGVRFVLPERPNDVVTRP
ncbi:MAG: hypothetical protein WAL32_10040 [Terriglobales bacterium]